MSGQQIIELSPVLESGPRWSVAGVFAGLLCGLILGWTGRTITADHRYVRSLAERHEAEASYYYKATDELIQQNKADIAKEKKQNGTKKN